MALAQAGLPCTLRDLLNTCDVVSAVRPSSNPPPAQAFQQQQQQGQHSPRGGGGSGGNNAVGRMRPIPDFYLEGGVPPPLPTSPPVASMIADAAGTGVAAAGAAAGEPAQQASAAGSKQHRGGRQGRGRKDGVPGSSRGAHQGKAAAWDHGYGGRGGDGAGWDEDTPHGGGGGRGGAEGGGYQLEVTVYSHRVVGEGYGSHTEYTVLTNASLPGFARREMEVARR